MSFSALSWAVRQKLPSTQKLVLLMLAERHNKDSGQCNPSLELLAEDCGLSRRSVIDQISKLQEVGYLTVRHRAKENLKLPSQYVLHLGFGTPEKLQADAFDPYLLPEKVVKDVHQGGESVAFGGEPASPPQCNTFTKVVKDVHQGGEPAAHKPGIEPVKEPNTEIQARAAARSTAIAKPDGVTEQTWSDWLQLRKTLRAAVTQTAIDGINREARRAGYTLEQALVTCCANGWRGFKAEWMQQRGAQGQAPRETAYQQQMRERVGALTPRFAAQPPKQSAGDFFRDQTIDVQAQEVCAQRMIGGRR